MNQSTENIGARRLHTILEKLLEEVSEVGNGDLSKEAEVTADMTGAIADSFNFMIGELRGIIGDEYGVDIKKVKWATYEEPHVAEYKDPSFLEKFDLAGKTLTPHGKVKLGDAASGPSSVCTACKAASMFSPRKVRAVARALA